MHARMGISLMAGLLLTCASVQLASAAPKRLGVPTFRGPGEGATRNAVMKAAQSNKYQVVGGQQIAKTASKLGVTLDANDAFLAVAKELGISAFVTGEVTKKKATLTVRNGADGSVSAEASWTGANPRKLSQAVGKTFWRRLGSAIDRTKAPSGSKQTAVAEEEAAPETGADEPAEEEPVKPPERKKVVVAAADDAEPDEDKESRRSPKKKKKGGDDEDADSETAASEKAEPDDDEDGARPEALILWAGPRVMSRSLTYVQDIYGANSQYKLAAAPEVGLNLDVYPAAFSGGGFLANVGLTAALAYMLPVVTSPAPVGMGQYGTYSLHWSVGAKVRLPLGLYGTIAYGSQRYQLVKPAAGGSGIDVPIVDYRFVRLGTGARIPLSEDWVVMGNLAYLHCLSLGPIASANYFPKGTGAAVEAGVGIGYRISSMLEIQGGAEIRRYGLNFHITPADAAPTVVPQRRIAGGAVDQYLMGWVGLAVILGGESRAGGSKEASSDDDEEREPPKKSKKKSDDEESEEASESEDEEPPKKSSKKKAPPPDVEL